MPTQNFLDFPLNSNLQPSDYLVGFYGNYTTPSEFRTKISTLAYILSTQINTKFVVTPTDMSVGAPYWDANGNLTLQQNGSYIGSQVYYIDPLNGIDTTGIAFTNNTISFFNKFNPVTDPALVIDFNGNVTIKRQTRIKYETFIDADLYVTGNIYGTVGQSQYADYSGNSIVSESCTGEAATAQYAYGAGQADRAIEADHAVNADNAQNSINSVYASQTVYANSASTADYATNAGTAARCTGNSATASVAVSAEEAGYAAYADNYPFYVQSSKTINLAYDPDFNILTASVNVTALSSNAININNSPNVNLNPINSDTIYLSYSSASQTISADINKSYVISTALIFG